MTPRVVVLFTAVAALALGQGGTLVELADQTEADLRVLIGDHGHWQNAASLESECEPRLATHSRAQRAHDSRLTPRAQRASDSRLTRERSEPPTRD